MVDLWAPLPLWLRLDGCVRALPAPAQLALVDVAVSGGSVRCGNDAPGTLDAIVPGAGASFGEMLSRGVVEYRDGVLSLRAPEPVQRPMAARNDLAPHNSPSPTPTPRTGPPSQSPERLRERKVRALFNGRTGICRDVPQGIEWAAWSTSPEGVAALKVGRSNDVSGNEGNDPASLVPERGNDPRNDPGTRQERPRNDPPSDSPSSRNNKREERIQSARDGNGNDPGNEGTGTRGRPPGTTPGNDPAEAPRCPTVETLGGMDVASLLDDLRRVSEDRVSRRATTQQELEFARLVNDLAGKGTTKADIIRGAKHVPHVGWMDGKPVTVSWLTKDGGKLIVDLVAGADGCERCKPARPLPRAPVAATNAPSVTDADLQETLKVFAERRAAKAQKATT